MASGTSTPGSSGEATMDRRLLEAAISGDVESMKHLVLYDPSIPLGTTPRGNTCLHIACIQGHEEFCKNVLTLDQSPALLSAVNMDGETPLLSAMARGRASLASALLRSCRDQKLSETIVKQDKNGCNVLHHAIRRGHKMLAVELIEAEPALSNAANIRGESPMFMAVMRNFTDVFERLLDITDSAHFGPFGFNVLHAAVRNINSNLVIVKRVMETRPWLARQEDENKYTPMTLAAYEGKIDVLTLCLEHDPSLGYLIISTNGTPHLSIATSQGHVAVARELLKHCPDAPYCDANGWTCLHVAISYGHKEFVQFVLGFQQLGQLVNMPNASGDTALHLAVRMSMTEIVTALQLHQDIDVAALNNFGYPASWDLINAANYVVPSVSIEGGTATTNSSGTSAGMDILLVEAATSGDATKLKHLALHDPKVLLGRTPQGNTCLHLSAIHGHEPFSKEVLALNQSLPLLTAINADGETPLLTAVTSCRFSLALFLLTCCRGQQLSTAILKQDNRGCNALHHTIRSGHRDLALELIEADPALSQAVNKYNESPMFIAVMRNYADVFYKLLKMLPQAPTHVAGDNEEPL